jgi:hypothetical protein
LQYIVTKFYFIDKNIDKMGASFSTRLSESNIELRNRIDAAATKVVLDSSFTDLTKLANEKYCNRLVKKVATIFQQNKDTVDLELLRQQLYDEKQEEKQKRGVNSEDANADVANADVANADVANADTEKTSEKHNKKIKTPRIQNVEKKCIQISKFYVLFAHLFSCIVSTINPTFKIEKEKTATSGAAQKEDTKSTAAGSSLDFCSSRIDALVNGELVENSDGDLLVKPNVCKTNVSKSGSPLHLIDLPGMKALQQLYKDANDGGDGEKEDARYLFKAFTGKDAPDHIRRLDQVPLKAYNKDEECKEQKNYNGGDPSEENQKKDERKDKERRDLEKERMFYFYNERDRKKNEEENARTGVYLKGIVGSLKERLFAEYVQHIKEMIERAEYNRSRLLEILSQMFTYTYGGNGSIGGVIINPSLTYRKLQSLVVQTRRIVIKLYTDCEEDYKHGLDIFFAMVQEKIAMKLSVQEEVLKKQLEDVMYGPPERYIPESLLYQQQFQGAEEFNKKQFVPPHFKSSVISIVKKGVPDTAFQQILPSLNEWINEEIENTTSLLDPKQVADEFIKENVYGDDEYGSSAVANIDSRFSSQSPSQSPASAPAPVYVAAPASTSAPIATPSKVKTSFSNIATSTSTSSKLLSGPSISPSPRKVKSRVVSDIQPRQLSFISEE